MRKLSFVTGKFHETIEFFYIYIHNMNLIIRLSKQKNNFKSLIFPTKCYVTACLNYLNNTLNYQFKVWGIYRHGIFKA